MRFKRGCGAATEEKVLDRVPGERLHCWNSDRFFDVWVDMRVAAAAGGALTTHIIQLPPSD